MRVRANMQDGIFDEAVKDVEAVAHTASPFHFNASDPKELIDPAYKGTTGILKSIQKVKYVLPYYVALTISPGIKRLVVTSSVASVMCSTSKPVGTHYTEKDWNEDSPKEVEEKGKETPAPTWYRASKTIAERALWGESASIYKHKKLC